MTRQNSTKPARQRKSVNAGKRAEAMRLLAENMAIVDVAREVRANRHTVRMWRDTPEGQQLLAEARIKRSKQFEGAPEQARSVLRENAVKAVQALVDDLRLPGRRGRAARDILDRVGVLRGEEVFIRDGATDLSKLSPEELASMEALLRKAKA